MKIILKIILKNVEEVIIETDCMKHVNKTKEEGCE